MSEEGWEEGEKEGTNTHTHTDTHVPVSAREASVYTAFPRTVGSALCLFIASSTSLYRTNSVSLCGGLCSNTHTHTLPFE